MGKDNISNRKVSWLLFFLFLCFAIAALGSFATHSSLEPWYATLKRPSWTPPPWIFPIAWTILYIMIAFSGWFLVSAEKSEKRTFALECYFAQLFLNFLWSFLFFYFRNPVLGLLDILLLVVFVALTIYSAIRVSKAAGVLLIPYFCWIVYAACLNTAIVLLQS